MLVDTQIRELNSHIRNLQRAPITPSWVQTNFAIQWRIHQVYNRAKQSVRARRNLAKYRRRLTAMRLRLVYMTFRGVAVLTTDITLIP